MNLSIDIARRYLFGKKSTNTINLITWLSIIGMAIGTAALILILSVFNGFEGILINTIGKYNPDLKVITNKGLYLQISEGEMESITKIQGVEKVSKVLEEVALFEYNGSQEAGIIKGVDEYYNQVIDFSNSIVQGDYKVSDSLASYAVVGNAIANKLSVSVVDPFQPLSIYVPKGGSNTLDLPFSTGILYPSSIFSFGGEQDAQIIISDLNFLQSLVQKEGKISGLEIKINDPNYINKIKSEIKNILRNKVTLKDRYELDEAFLKIMNIERWVSFLIAILTLCIISFNMVGSLWMIVIDKKKDISLLKSVGLSSISIRNIYRFVGIGVGLIGFIIGLVAALIFYVLQKKFNLISVPDGFAMQGYPIELRFSDIVLVFVTVMIIAFLASILPALRASRISAFVRQE
jgi:lipoprotein-releasing system permease protein